MKNFLIQCFEECTNTLKAVSKSWKDIDEIVFVGGAANSIYLESVFKHYMQSYCSIDTYNSKNRKFDVLYAAVNCAVLDSITKGFGDLSVINRGNRI